ncbi:MAG: ribonuclease Z [Flavobacteriaceae bacterium]
MKLHILGCYAATPSSTTNPTAQVLNIKNHLFLIDCGEGTQVALRKAKIKFSRINHIFISHLHGDHFFGLPGLVSSFRLLGRERELHVYGPKGLKEAITLLLKLGDSWTNYPLRFHELSEREPQLIFEDEKVTVTTIPLDHRIYTNGFLFREKPGERGLNYEMAVERGVHQADFQNLKNGRNVVLEDGSTVLNHEVTFDPPKPKSYAYCSDTGYHPPIIDQITGVDALYHESTFLQSEAHLAQKTKHATAEQAAQIAKASQVGRLILGHYSTRYKSLEGFKEEAKPVFENVMLADDGIVFEL